MNTKQLRQTELLELVETHNIARSLKRMRDTGPYDTMRWKRAVYHALGLANISDVTIKKVREALELP